MASDKLMLNNIQMLRAVAAIAVVLHHAYPHYEAMGGHMSVIKSVSHWGFLGVDIFFVISGFIMAYTTFNKERTFENAKTFFKHRLFRIYLGYWPFFLMMLAALYLTNSPRLATIDSMGSLFLLHTDMSTLVLPISWSLTYELYFYTIFVFTFFFSIKQLYVLLPLLVSFIVCLALYPYVYTFLAQHVFFSLPPLHLSALFLEFPPLLLEFFSGVFLYMYKEHLLKTGVLKIAVLVCILSYGIGIQYEYMYGLLRAITFGLGAFSLILIVLILEYKHIFRAGKYLESLGNASYTLYLSHLLVIQAFYYLGLRGLFSSGGVLLPLVGLMLIVLLSVLFSLVYYKKIEKPIYQKAIGK